MQKTAYLQVGRCPLPEEASDFFMYFKRSVFLSSPLYQTEIKGHADVSPS